MRAAVVTSVVAGLALPAHADRAVHGSLGVGSSLLLTGAEGDHLRFDAALDLKPGSRYGAVLAWRGFDGDHRGLVTAGLAYEGGAARPRLVLDLHADLGVDLDHRIPAAGGGVRATLMIYGPAALVFDLTALAVIDGLDHSRLQLAGATLLAARW